MTSSNSPTTDSSSNSPSAGNPPGSAAPSTLGRNILIATVFAVFVYAAMAIYADVNALGQVLRDYTWPMFGLGIALATANYFLRFLRWQYYLRHLGIEGVPFLESLRIFVAGFVMSVTPGKVGEVLKSVLLLEARGVPIETSAPIVVVERLTDLIALVLLVAVGSLIIEGGWPIAVGGGVVVVGLWVTCAWRPLGEFALRIAARLPVLKNIAPKLRQAYDSLRELTTPKPLFVATLFSLASWFLECLALLVIAMGFDITLTILQATFTYSAPTIVGALALLPGGLGVTEAGMTSSLQTFGGVEMTLIKATAITILVRLATLWWAVVLGAGALFWHRRVMKVASQQTRG